MTDITSEFNLSNEFNVNDDFYRHVNNKWIKDNDIPEDKNRWGTFDLMREENKYRVKKIFDDIQENKLEITLDNLLSEGYRTVSWFQ